MEGTVDFTRWRDGFDPTKGPARTVTIFGCGGIGSPLALALTKLGVHRQILIDYDVVEPHNIPNQAFAVNQVGQQKCHALGALVKQFGISHVHEFDAKLTPDGWEDANEQPASGVVLNGIVVSAPDNMDARRLLAEKCMATNGVTHIVDPRIAGEYIRLEVCDLAFSESREAYMKTLYSDEQAMQLPCTRQSVIWVANFVAAFTARAIGRILSGDPVEEQMAFSSEKSGMFLMAGGRPG
jgi:molybdopterin/thiamine biosynthesis adenylyltransferase